MNYYNHQLNRARVDILIKMIMMLTPDEYSKFRAQYNKGPQTFLDVKNCGDHVEKILRMRDNDVLPKNNVNVDYVRLEDFTIGIFEEVELQMKRAELERTTENNWGRR